MSQRGSIFRYGLIVKKLKQKPYSTFEEIRDYIEYQLSFIQADEGHEDLTIGLSIRTFQREIKNMYQLYGIQIEYSRKEKGYYIAESIHDTTSFDRMMEAFDVYNSLNIVQDVSPYVILHKRQQTGVHHLFELLNAMKKSHVIHIEYRKFNDEFPVKRILEPYAVKEFKNRWYLIAYEMDSELSKTYALDRIISVQVTQQHFERQAHRDVSQMFESTFGIMKIMDQEPEEVLLSMGRLQAEYLKTLPLHSSQKIISEDESNSVISVTVQITQDFIMELMSLGMKIKVLSPQHLVENIKNQFFHAYKQYQ